MARTQLVVFLLLLQQTLVHTQAGGADLEEGAVIAQSDFWWDMDGWAVEGEADGPEHASKAIKATDTGPSVWYFSAPSKFLGNQRQAYGGKLSYSHGFFEYDSQGKDFMGGEYDVILSSEAHSLSVGKKGVIPAWEFSSDHTIELNEQAGWLVKDTKTSPSRRDMLRLLSRLSSIQIRGGFYAGNEDSYIMNVKLTAGPKEHEPAKSSLKAQNIMDAVQLPERDQHAADTASDMAGAEEAKGGEQGADKDAQDVPQQTTGKEEAKKQKKEEPKKGGGGGMFNRMFNKGGDKEL